MKLPCLGIAVISLSILLSGCRDDRLVEGEAVILVDPTRPRVQAKNMDQHLPEDPERQDYYLEVPSLATSELVKVGTHAAVVSDQSKIGGGQRPVQIFFTDGPWDGHRGDVERQNLKRE